MNVESSPKPKTAPPSREEGSVEADAADQVLIRLAREKREAAERRFLDVGVHLVQKDAVEELGRHLDSGVAANWRDPVEHRSLLGWALFCAAPACAHELLTRLAVDGPESFEAAAPRGLWCAVASGSAACVELALRAGADPNGEVGPCAAVDGAGPTPLMAAASTGQASIVDLLIKAGSDPLAWRGPPMPGGCEGGALGEAVRAESRACAASLLAAMSNAAAARGEQGAQARQRVLDAALRVAAQNGAADWARDLLAQGASMDGVGASGEETAFGLALEALELGRWDVHKMVDCVGVFWEASTPEQRSDTRGRRYSSPNLRLARLAELEQFDPVTERVEALRLARELRGGIPDDGLPKMKGPRV